MAYLDRYNLVVSGNLKPRLTAAIAKLAMDVLNEDPGTANHANRILWAKAALVHPEVEATKMMWGLVGNASVAASGEAASDGDIEFVASGLIDTFANGV